MDVGIKGHSLIVDKIVIGTHGCENKAGEISIHVSISFVGSHTSMSVYYERRG